MRSPDEKPAYRRGIKVWHSPASPKLDICFVHGLNGDRDKTWTPANDDQPWPPRLLPQTFKHARLITFGYDADVLPSGTASRGTLVTIADHLNRSIKADRQEAKLDHLPIIFVAHSLGGLICKRAIYRSFHEDEAKIKAISSCLLGIIFMGTPHTGSAFANVFSPLVSGISFFKSTGRLLKALKKDGEQTTSLNQDFVRVLKKVDERMPIFCFFENRTLRGAKYLIVNEASATYAQWQSGMIDADHNEMVKFQSENDPDFKIFRDVITDFLDSKRAQAFSSLHLSVTAAAAPSDAPAQASDHTAELDGAGHEGDGCRPASQSPFHPSPAPARSSQAVSYTSERQSVDSQAISEAPQRSLPLRPPRPPRICHLYFGMNSHFVGREDVLDTLQSFFDGDCRTVALFGLGGVGKTQVANAFAHRIKSDMPEYSVAWLPTISRAGFQDAYTAIAKKLGIKAGDKGDVVDRTCDYISNDTARLWFIIIDNADDPTLICGRDSLDSLDRYFPKGDHVRTLVTTRTTTVARSLADETVELEAFGPAQALQLAQRLLGKKFSALAPDEAIISELLQDLEFLPLAISQAMAFMVDANVSAKEYLQLLRATDSDRVDLLGTEVGDNTRYKESAHAVATTWLVSFDHMRKDKPDAVQMLGFLSQVLPKAVPVSMLPALGSQAKTAAALMVLQAYSFVSRQGDFLDMHRLVHVAASSWFHKNSQSKNVNRSAFMHISSVYPNPNYDNQGTWSPYLAHARHMLDSKQSLISRQEWELCHDVSKSLFFDGLPEAVRYGEMAVNFFHDLPESDPDRLASQHVLATAYEANGQIQKAVDLLEHVVRIREKILPESHPNRLMSQAQLASTLFDDGRVQRAKTMMRHVVSVSQASMPHHPRCQEYQRYLEDMEELSPDA